MIKILFYFLLIIFTISCSDNNQKSSVSYYPITEQEFWMWTNQSSRYYKYLFQGKNVKENQLSEAKRIELKEYTPQLKQFYKIINKESISTALECNLLTLSDFEDLLGGNSKSQWLRDKGFFLYDIITEPSRKIKSHINVHGYDELFYGRCRRENRERYSDKHYFRQVFQIQNAYDGSIEFHYDENHLAQWKSIENELKEKGEVLDLVKIFKKENKSKIDITKENEKKAFQLRRLNRFYLNNSIKKAYKYKNQNWYHIATIGWFKEEYWQVELDNHYIGILN